MLLSYRFRIPHNLSIFVRIFMGGRGRPPLRNEVYIAFGCRGGLSSAYSVKSQNDCHRQSATPTSREMLIKLCGYPYQNQNNFIEFIARSPVPSAAPGRQCNNILPKNCNFAKNFISLPPRQAWRNRGTAI